MLFNGRARSIPALFAAAALVVGLVACGAGAKASPEQTVREFYAAFTSGRFAHACSLLTSDAIPDMRDDAIGTFRATAHGRAAYRRQVQAAYREGRTCPGALRLLRTELKPHLMRLRALANLRGATHIVDKTALIGDNQEWILVIAHGHWRIQAANAMLDAANG